MRISVLTGLFACAVIFMVSSDKTSAAPLEMLQTKETETTVLAILSSANGEVKVSDNEEKEAEPTKPEIVKYTVADDETLSEISEKYETTWKRIYDKNIQIEDPNIINTGEVIEIPKPEEVLEPRALPEPPVQTRPQPVSTNTGRAVSKRTDKPSYNAPASSSGNRYVAGYCTWYVKNRRPDLPNNLGNASTWVSRAAAQGYSTGSTPVAGAVGQQGNHVVFVESVNGDGTVTISEMNFVGWNTVSARTVAASSFVYIY